MLILLQFLLLPVLALYLLLVALPLHALYVLTNSVKTAGMKLYGHEIKRKPLARMAKAFPFLSENEIQQQVDRHFTAMSWFAAEFIKGLSPFDRHTARNSQITNPDKLRQVVDSNRVTICYCSHSYNYENLIALASKVIPGADIYVVYSSTGNLPLIDYVINYKRTKHSHNVYAIPASSSMLLYKTALSHKTGKNPRHAVFAILGDVKANYKLHTVDFLNSQRPIVLGGEKIGLRLGATFFYVSCVTKARGCNDFTFKVIESKPGVTKYYFNLLESDIAHHPAEWMLWNE